MSVRICILDNSNISFENDAYAIFGRAEQERLCAIKNEQRRKESAAGLMALHRLLRGCPRADIVRDRNGRPRFDNDVEVDFNVSHSGSLSAAAVIHGKESRVGLDIERIDAARGASFLRIAERYFTEEEKKLLDESGRVDDFYRIWTAKEARAKLTGAGLSYVLSDNSLCGAQGKYHTSHFSVVFGEERYILALCTDEKTDVEFVCDGILVEPLV